MRPFARPTICSVATRLLLGRSLPRLLVPPLILTGFFIPATPTRGGSIIGSAGWGWDNNAREAMVDREKVADRFLRLTGEAVPDPLRRQRFSAGLRLRGLAEKYSRFASESRYQGDATLDLRQGLGKKVSAWGTAWIQGRTYPDSLVRNFARGSAAVGLQGPLRGGSVGMGIAARGIDYHRTPEVDTRGQAVTIEIRRPLRRSLEGRLVAEFESVRWDRPAIRRVGEDLFETSGHQHDRGRQFQFEFRYLRDWLLEATGGIESIRSNSFGYSIRRLSLEGRATGWLPGSVLLQVGGRIESVTYRDAGLEKVYIVRAGEDLEAAQDNNSFTAQVRRPLLKQVAIEARASWFRNESLLVGYHYRKALAAIALVWVPVGASEF
jgi:hypothetical protein